MESASNPYRPPTAAVEPDAGEITQAMEVAGKGRRFLTWVIDYVGFLVANFVIVVAIGVAFGVRSMEALQGGWSYVLGFVVMLGYYVFFEGLFGRTPGKLVLGTKVVDLKGRPPTLRAILGRSLARFVPFEGLSFFGKRGFHDQVSNTQVVRCR